MKCLSLFLLCILVSSCETFRASEPGGQNRSSELGNGELGEKWKELSVRFKNKQGSWRRPEFDEFRSLLPTMTFNSAVLHRSLISRNELIALLGKPEREDEFGRLYFDLGSEGGKIRESARFIMEKGFVHYYTILGYDISPRDAQWDYEGPIGVAEIGISFISDGKSWLSAHGPKPIKPTKLKKAAFDLPIGEYKVQLARAGYKPVGIILRVNAGHKYEPVRLKCKEKGIGGEIDWKTVPVIAGESVQNWKIHNETSAEPNVAHDGD